MQDRREDGKMNENNSYSEYAVEVHPTSAMRCRQIAVIGVTAVSLVMALMVYWVFLLLLLFYLADELNGRKDYVFEEMHKTD